jgi:hypothetical protein
LYSIELQVYKQPFHVSLFELVILVASFVLEVEVQNECHTVDQENCTMQSALSVERNVKFPLNQIKTDLYIAENVMQVNDLQEEDISFKS